jgi:hypothetical protein
MRFDRYYQVWRDARGRHDLAHVREPLQEAIKAVASLTTEEIAWLVQALRDNNRKLFVAYILRQAAVFPQELFEPMLQAAIDELNPSVCRTFVEPCISAFGQVPTIEHLMRVVRMGPDFDKAGAVNAMHWTYNEKGGADLTSRASSDHALEELVGRRRILFMDTFVNNTNLDVRRSIMCQLELEPLLYPPQLKEKVKLAQEIARTHPDEYIRHRVDVQLGRARSVYPLPQRQAPGTVAGPVLQKSWWQRIWG